MPDIQAGNILRGRATRGLFCGALPISAVIQFDFPEPLHNFGLHATTVGGAGTPQHAALMSLKLRTIDPDGDLDALMEGTFGLAKSGLAHIGWFNYLSTGSSELRSTMEVVLPQGVECTAVDIVPWGQGAPVTLTGLSLEWVAGA
ncbi:hypothetical protein [Luteococcus sp.]|uniref:hypothetical protein n=1 Tax=Luteococcus sp. TaxID=1969402 RepID=UPI003735C098